jgi:hypothetical protein
MKKIVEILFVSVFSLAFVGFLGSVEKGPADCLRRQKLAQRRACLAGPTTPVDLSRFTGEVREFISNIVDIAELEFLLAELNTLAKKRPCATRQDINDFLAKNKPDCECSFSSYRELLIETAKKEKFSNISEECKLRRKLEKIYKSFQVF